MTNPNRIHKNPTKAATRGVREDKPAPAAQAISPHAAVQRLMTGQGAASPADLITLQRTVGNRAVARLIQTKLKVGAAGDEYEQEADRIAHQVVHHLDHPGPIVSVARPSIQRENDDRANNNGNQNPQPQINMDCYQDWAMGPKRSGAARWRRAGQLVAARWRRVGQLVAAQWQWGVAQWRGGVPSGAARAR